MSMLRSIVFKRSSPLLTRIGVRHQSNIPFDTKPFPFQRFEPCCPDAAAATENGFVPCKSHPIPKVLGKKIELTEDMVGPSSYRHMVICVGPDGLEWTRGKVETAKGGIMETLLGHLMEWIQAKKTKNDFTDLLPTVCERPSETAWPTSDILVFPDFNRYPAVSPKNLKESPFWKVMDTLWMDCKVPKLPEIEHDKMEGVDAVILVCTHTQRDKRCGVIGPMLVDEFRKSLKELGLDKKVEVWGTSHFGGHRFAGNVIIHQRGLGGHMYGNVRQCHVRDLVDRHVVNGKVVREMWRGQVTPPTLENIESTESAKST
ncbi:Sucrase/ferredoxin-like-domain-containing protein [Radiomyces spectabilis]|uniref:Sucrase/ferredoxin-like-domain-containing protein n=1 Tax=Radiomyces spectabilis TaxID=64574 RepID=UPI00222114A1|nr:Sucrase/ferredoxin-like-domain-containing protein [Radiomyces spectabilis]KAI8376408.1 Sucrase/ferredoxin-like-domain-containing protein [Radiomyces spectabilis]